MFISYLILRILDSFERRILKTSQIQGFRNIHSDSYRDKISEAIIQN